jgi:nucleotide sugar dehydrogenase
VNSASTSVAKNFANGVLVILESTTYPGTTEEAVMPILAGGSKVCGKDFNLAFSPERIDPGNKTFGLVNTPKVVGGVTANCADRAANFYRRFVGEVIIAKGTREAEMAKLLENTYRHVNIALVNELAQFCHEMKIDIWDVIRCASSKPFGFQAFYPSAGVGGHCIPIDPNYLAYKVRADLGHPFRFVHLAEEINRAMPSYVVRRVQEILNESKKALNGSRVLLMGVTYKPNISDTRETPAEDVARGLFKAGCDVSYSDPYVDAWTVSGTDVPAIKFQVVDTNKFDVIVVLQFHEEFRSWFQLIDDSEIGVLDTTGTLNSSAVQRL